MPDDLEIPHYDESLRGVSLLARSALSAPPPPEKAETESRRLVEDLMQRSALSPKVLREAQKQPHRPWWRKLFTKG